MTYRVLTTRDGDWWSIEADDPAIRIATQARDLADVASVAADALTLWFADEGGPDVAPLDVDVVVVDVPRSTVR